MLKNVSQEKKKKTQKVLVKCKILSQFFTKKTFNLAHAIVRFMAIISLLSLLSTKIIQRLTKANTRNIIKNIYPWKFF